MRFPGIQWWTRKHPWLGTIGRQRQSLESIQRSTRERSAEQRLAASAATAVTTTTTAAATTVAAASTAAAVTTTTAATASATRAFFAWSSFVDRDGTTGNILTVEGLDRLIGTLLVGHLDKRETAWSARLAIHDHVNG